MNACALCIESASIELRLLSGGTTVNDNATKVAQASCTFRGVLTTEHLEDRVYAFPIGHSLDGIFIVDLLVVNYMLKSEFLRPGQFVIGRRGAVHLDPKYLSDLDCCCAHAPGNCVYQDA